MTTEELTKIYNDLNSLIIYLNNPEFPHLDAVIDSESKRAADQSLTQWLKSLPKSLIYAYYDYDISIDILKDKYREDYSVPFLHLKNQLWAKAIVSKQIAKQEVSNIIETAGPSLELLAKNVPIALSYSEYSDLNTDEEELVYKAQKIIYQNLGTLKTVTTKLESLDEVREDLDLSFDYLYSNRKYFEQFFNTGNFQNMYIEEAATYIQNLYMRISKNNITNYRKEIKSLWKKRKDKSIQEELNKLSLNEVQKVVNQIKPNFDLRNYFSNTGDFLKVKTSTLEKLYGFNSLQVEQIKTVIEGLKSEIEKRAYPRIDADNLSDDDYRLLELINNYQNNSEIKNVQINILKEELLQLSKLINSFKDLAVDRYNANLLPDDKFIEWSNKELEIYQSYISVKKMGDSLVKDETKNKNNRLRLQKDYVENAADYNGILSNIVDDKPTFSNLTNLPNFVVNSILKEKLNTTGLKLKTLRNYQNFGAKYILHYKKALLGDEMGLGKTIEALTVINHLHNQGKRHFIVVAPLSILSNWEKEIASKTHILSYKFHGFDRMHAYNEWMNYGGILVTNYEQCGYLRELTKNDFIDMIVVDEAHSIKNKMALRTQNIRSIISRSDYVLLITGTPLENRIDEMNSLVETLSPKIAAKLETLSDLSSEVYNKTVASVYLRRRRIDVLKDLPRIISIQSYSNFTEEQKAEYQKAVLEDKFMLMRRIAFLGTESEKIEQIKQICEDAKENNEKVLIFSFFKNDVIFKLQKILKYVASDPITGDLTADKRQKVIEDFSKSRNQFVLLCQITAAGYGLNIQAASRVIICEPQLKPSIEQQAISRAYRMGQTHTVTVYHLITENSLDETMIDMLDYKQKIFDKFADKSVAAEVLRNVETNEEVVEKSVLSENIKAKVLRKEKERILNEE